MSDANTVLIVFLLASLIFFVLGFLIRTRGPRGLVNGIDWDRVKDPSALGRFVGNTMIGLGVLHVAWGSIMHVLVEQSRKDLLNLVCVIFVALLTALVLVLILGMRRHYDLPAPRKPDGRR